MSRIIILIDPQRGFARAGTGPAAGRIVELLEHANESDLGVVVCCYRNETGSRFETQLGWRGFQKEDDRKIIGSMENLLLKRPKFWHGSYGIFTKELLGYIKEMGVTEMYMAGFLTDVSVLKAALDAFDLGYDVKVISDCCATHHGKPNQEYAIDTLRHAIGRKNVVGLRDFLIRSIRPDFLNS